MRLIEVVIKVHVCVRACKHERVITWWYFSLTWRFAVDPMRAKQQTLDKQWNGNDCSTLTNKHSEEIGRLIKTHKNVLVDMWSKCALNLQRTQTSCLLNRTHNNDSKLSAHTVWISWNNSHVCVKWSLAEQWMYKHTYDWTVSSPGLFKIHHGVYISHPYQTSLTGHYQKRLTVTSI